MDQIRNEKGNLKLFGLNENETEYVKFWGMWLKQD